MGFVQSSLVGLHGWEEEHFLNVVGVRQQHGQAVNTHSPSGSWRKSVFKGADEVFVNALGLLVTVVLGSSLLLEGFQLDLRII